MANRDIIVIGSSAGGVDALQRLMGGLRPDLPAAVFIVQHTWGAAPSYLASILSRAGRMPVTEAQNGVSIERGKVYVAPADYHLHVERGHMLVLRGPRENRTRPAINPLFRSAATAYGNRTIGVILTGTLDDGVAGLWAIKHAGGIAIAQSDAQCTDMPQAAAENVELDHFVPLEEIPSLLHRFSSAQVEPEKQAVAPPEIWSENGGTRLDDLEKLDQVARRSVLTCPDCNGALWEMDQGVLEYRCHVGHAFSPQILRLAQSRNVEQSLWTALKALKESAALDQRLATRSGEQGLDKAAAAYSRNAEDKLIQVEHLQQFLAVVWPAGAPVDAEDES